MQTRNPLVDGFRRLRWRVGDHLECPERSQRVLIVGTIIRGLVAVAILVVVIVTFAFGLPKVVLGVAAAVAFVLPQLWFWAESVLITKRHSATADPISGWLDVTAAARQLWMGIAAGLVALAAVAPGAGI